MQLRGGTGRLNYRLSQKTGLVAGMCIVQSDDELFIFSANGYVLCMDVAELRCRGRIISGVIAMKLREGDKVTSICRAR